MEQKCGTKNAEQKLVGTLRHWVLGIPSASAKRSVEQKCGIKNGRTKILVGNLTDPKCKYQKFSGTKMRNKKGQNKNLVGTLKEPKCKYKKVSGTKNGRTKNSGTKIWWGPSGTLSASTERSAEQKVAEQKFWWGPLQTLSASTKRSVEQKCGTKSAEQKFGGDPEGA